MTETTLNNNKAIVVFSGGQDSTTCLFYAKSTLTKSNLLRSIMDSVIILKLK